jgi:hypothetical protein
MARSKIPDPLERRLVIERSLGEAQALRIAEGYLEEGRVIEALDFLEKAGANEQLSALRRQAVEAGDAFLLRSVAAAMSDPPATEEWEALANAASAAGMERYADDARRQAARGED